MSREDDSVPTSVRMQVYERDHGCSLLIMDQCLVEGCDKPRKKGRTLCSMHAARKERHGDPSVLLWQRRRVNQAGYVILSGQWGHPLADGRGELYEHRKVLWEVIGPGEHPCHWCQRSLSWTDGTLVADHLDWNKTNNDLTNLVASCQTCNKIRDEPKPMRLEISSCLVCGTGIVGAASKRYCSGACQNVAYRRRKRGS